MSEPVIYVCHAGPCRNAGSEAVLLEIEELARGLGRCTVRPSGCLGNCSQAPNAIILKSNRESLCARIRDVEKSAAVVQQALESAPNLEDPERAQRLADARQMRIREASRESNKWNTALKGLAEEVTRSSGSRRLQLQFEHAQLLASVGHLELALDVMADVARVAPNNIQVGAECAQILGRLGRVDEVKQIRKMFLEDLRVDGCLVNKLFATRGPDDTWCSHGLHRIQNYSMWRLDGITPVSNHSAIYHFTTDDAKRGTPNPRGKRGQIWPKTWHTTLLAEVGPNDEGPLMWIERDYTPISSAKEWESGKVDILIKIYDKGLATSWLHSKSIGCNVWLSQPARTLGIPSLVSNIGEANSKFTRPASVLLLLAGSGIVVAPQVLQHQDPVANLGVSTPGLHVPINLIYSCRKDDICMVMNLAAWCTSGMNGEGQSIGLRRCTLLLTEPQAEAVAPFPSVKENEISDFEALGNTNVLQSRLSTELLTKELSMMQNPCRIVVSGPESFNAAARSMLSSSGVDADSITVLEA